MRKKKERVWKSICKQRLPRAAREKKKKLASQWCIKLRSLLAPLLPLSITNRSQLKSIAVTSDERMILNDTSLNALHESMWWKCMGVSKKGDSGKAAASHVRWMSHNTRAFSFSCCQRKHLFFYHHHNDALDYFIFCNPLPLFPNDSQRKDPFSRITMTH